MYITDCLAYTDIAAEQNQNNETFVVTLKTHHATDISLILNYLQVKVLAEGLLAVINQAYVREFLDTSSGNILGDMQVKWDIHANEESAEEREEGKCRPNILSVLMEENSLSKTA